MMITRLTGPGIAEVVTGYLADEDDLIFKRPVLQRLFSEAVAVPCLNWEQRPEKVKERVTELFERCSRSLNNRPGWFYFGQPKYSLCGIDEGPLFKSIILQAYPAQKEFWFVDIGAGNFQCGQRLLSYLAEENLPEDIQVNIVGLRGEPNLKENVPSPFKRFREIRLGSFKIEDIAKEFERCGLPKGQIDLAVCRLTLTHLNDQPGTMAQIHDLLRPGTGVFCNDSLPFLDHVKLGQNEYDPDHHDEDSNSYSLIQLLLDMGSPFLVARGRDSAFLLKRPGSDPCRLPMRYLPSESGYPKFAREPAFKNPWEIDPVPANELYLCGSRSLFDWLQKNKLIEDQDSYLPIQPLLLDPKVIS